MAAADTTPTFDAASARISLSHALLQAAARHGKSRIALEDPARKPLSYGNLVLGALVLGRKLAGPMPPTGAWAASWRAKVTAPPQSWRSQPREFKDLFEAASFGQRQHGTPLRFVRIERVEARGWPSRMSAMGFWAERPLPTDRVRRWWGVEVTSIYDGSSSSPLLSGLMWTGVYDECLQAEYTGIALEYGTEPTDEVIACLRAEQWPELHPEADGATRSAIKKRFRDAFYTDTPGWKQPIVDQGLAAARQAVAGLAG
jgi:hypothetical protein